MGRYSDNPQATYNKFERMKEFYAKYGKDWKSKVTVSNSSKVITHFDNWAIKIDGKAEPIIQEKIDRINAFVIEMMNSMSGGYNVYCTECNGRLYEESCMVISLQQYEGLKCPTKKQCRMQNRR